MPGSSEVNQNPHHVVMVFSPKHARGEQGGKEEEHKRRARLHRRKLARLRQLEERRKGGARQVNRQTAENRKAVRGMSVPQFHNIHEGMDRAAEVADFSTAATPASARSGYPRTHRSTKAGGGAMASGPSNRKLVCLALKHRCLAGAHLSNELFEAVDSVKSSRANHFVILFGKLSGNKFRGLYALQGRPRADGPNKLYKIYGVGPQLITNDMIKRLYRYNSGSRSFQQLAGARSMTTTTSAISLMPECYSGGNRHQRLEGGPPRWVEEDLEL